MDPKNNSATPVEEDSPPEFPIYEIVDSSDEALPTPKSPPRPGNKPLVRRCNRNADPPKFCGKRYFIDVVDEPQAVSGSALNPIVLDYKVGEHLALLFKKLPWI